MHTWRKWKTEIVEKVKAAKKLHKTRLRELLEKLVEIDRTLSENVDKDLLMEADELFNVIFKITYYDFPEHAVCNSPLTELTSEQTPLQHDQLLEMLEGLDKAQAKINVAVNNLLLHFLD